MNELLDEIEAFCESHNSCNECEIFNYCKRHYDIKQFVKWLYNYFNNKVPLETCERLANVVYYNKRIV